MATFTRREISLLYHHLKFYQSLHAGVTPSDTEEREHFLNAVLNKVEPETEHEKVYIKYLSSNQQKVDGMIHDWRLGKSNPLNPNFDDEIF